jgi:hypothetical protein
MRAKEHLKIAAGEGTYAMFGYNNVVRFGSERRVDGTGCALKKLLVLDIRFERGKQLVPTAYLRQAWAKTNLNVDDCHTSLPRRREHARRALQELFRGLNVDRHNASLAIQGKNGGA